MAGELSLEVYKDFEHATVYWVKNHPHIGLIQSRTSYIPIDQFKQIFNSIEGLAQQHPIRRIIFDKTSLSVFHQPSMEWYFVAWKTQMADLGIVEHVKILPNDEVFKHSVLLGRKKIKDQYPDARFNTLRIEYADSIEEAVQL